MEAVATEFESPPSTADAPQRSMLRRIFSALSTQRSALLLLIVVGAILRFSFLDRPPIWFDEAATFGRTSGTYLQMLDSLEEAGFGPLHYSAYWWIKNGCPLWGKIDTVRAPAFIAGDGFGHRRPGAERSTGMVDARNLIPTHPMIAGGKVLMTPFIMRLIPATCGTLMILAMYWLALEIFRNRRIALIAAAMTTFSAYLLNYSRDAKMYMELWLFVALNVASLLWWLRTRDWLAWGCWIVSGTIMLGLHMLGSIAIAIELVFLIAMEWRSFAALLFPLVFWLVALIDTLVTGVRAPEWSINLFLRLWLSARWTILAGFIGGLALMSIGPYGYFVKFNGYVTRIHEVGWHATGVQWIPMYNAGRTGPELLRYATSAFFVSWEWPKPSDEHEVAARVTWWLKNGCFALLALAAITLLPWRAVASGWRRWRGAQAPPDPVGTPRWRAIFCVIIWIALPVYVVYILSIQTREFPFASPDYWLRSLLQFAREHVWLIVALALIAIVSFLFSQHTWQQRMRQSASFVAVLLLTFLLLRTTYWVFDSKWVDDQMSEVLGRSWKYHGSLWIPRYLGVIVPALFVLSAALIARLPGRIVQACAVAVFVAINLGQYSGRVFADSEPPVERMVQDSIEYRQNERTGDGSVKMYYSMRMPPMGAGLGPGTGLLGLPTSNYYWVIKTNSPATPDEIRGLGEGLNTNFPSTFGSLPSTIKRDVQTNKKLKKLIVWDSPRNVETSDKVLDALGKDWQLAPGGDETFYAREHWTWRTLLTIRRRTYLKNPAPPPATWPATTQSSSR